MYRKKISFKIILFLFLSIPCISRCQSTNGSFGTSLQASPAEKHWLPYVNFEASKFKNPSRKFGPYVRWWWPGNDVTKKELKREIQIFAQNGFAGVEIQPFAIGINPNAPKDRLKAVYSWDSDSYYKKLQAVMEQAKQSNITVDLTAGSGWPLSTPVTTPQDGMKELTYADTVVSGNQKINIPIPKDIFTAKSPFRTYKKPDISSAKIQAVIAARVIKKDSGQVYLDHETANDISGSVSNHRIKWKISKEGDWEIIAIWSVPTMEANPFAAKKDPLYVVNHFDSTKIQASYDYLFGDRTGLKKYYGDPFRGIFNDSYELRPTVHFASNIFSKFKDERGYDISKWLPNIMRMGSGGSFNAPNENSKYIMSDQGDRLKYDFNTTISDILIKQLIVGSDHWAESKGLLHRTQPYGPGIDVIGASGHADIPGTEQLYDGGSEGFVKLVTSGAHLYNRSVITQESFVFWQRAFMTTPQKIKALSNKAFTAGVNQIIYHGSPYKYKTNDYGKEGWSPFTSPYGTSDFSSHINESNPYWKDIDEVNSYITRSQYVMRSGTSQADVLIYDPQIGSNVGPNPQEKLVGGYFKGVEPKDGASVPRVDSKYSSFWETINKLEASGITWDYVNDESLQQAKIKNGKIDIRDNTYKAIVLPDISSALLSSTRKISSLSKKDANILIIGNLPNKQPSFLDYQKKDQETQQLFNQISQQANTQQLADASLMNDWISKLPQEIRYKDNYQFARQSSRELKDGSQLHYLWNMSDQWKKISFVINQDAKFEDYYWLSPSDGTVAESNNKELSHFIPPFGSIILYASMKSVADSILSVPKPLSKYVNANEVAQIKRWDISAGETSLNDSPLFDWRDKKAFKFKSSEGVYRGSFNLDKKSQKKYLIDLGKVYFTAEVFVNNHSAGKSIWSPYTLDVTDLLHSGKNKIKIIVTPTMLNGLIGQGQNAKKNKKYFQFKKKENQLMPAGLLGPVTIKSF